MNTPDSDQIDTGQEFDERYFKDTYGCDGLGRFGMHWWSVRWYAAMARRCLQDTGGHRLLEVGCGHGFMLALLEAEFDTVGIDISEYAIDQASRFAPGSACSVANIEDELPTDLASSKFDVVVAKYVFEHLHNPLEAMRRVAALLRPGGILFLSVPNTESIGARWKRERWYANQDPTHCSLLAPNRWLEIVNEAGLVVSRESADGYWDLPYVRWLPAWIQLPFFIGPTAVSCLAGRAILPPRFGENLLIFARQPVNQETT